MASEIHSTQEDEVLSKLPLGLLLARVSGALRARLLERCPEAGGDIRMVGLALAIDGIPGATQADYARFLGVDLNTASRLITRAESDGMLRKMPSPKDRRAHVLVLTVEGKAIADKGAGAVLEVEGNLMEDIGATILQDFRSIAEHLLRLLA